MRRFVLAMSAVAVLVIGGVAYAQTSGADTIYACVNNGDGSIRQVASADTACPKGWHKLNWASAPAHIPVTTTYKKSETVTLDPDDDLGFADIDCTGDDVATGGGYILGSSVTQSVERFEPITDPFSNDDTPTGWSVLVLESQRPHVTGAFVAYAICQHTE